MSSLFGTPRRGVRAIVARGPVIGGKLALTLECGHIVRRGVKSLERPSAVCPECKITDGAKRDDGRKGAA